VKKAIMAEDESTKKNVRSRMSMRDKLLDKQKTNQEHTRNWGAGRVTIHERYLHRTGIRGRKRYILFGVLILVFLLCLINLIILCIALSKLRIDSTGMRDLSFLQNGKLRWTGDSDLQHVWLKDGELKTYKDMDLVLEGDNKKVYLQSGSLVYLAAGDGEVNIQANCFKFVVPGEEKTVFQMCEKEVLIDVPLVDSEGYDELITPRVTSPYDATDLNVSSMNSTYVQGNEGVFVDTKKLTIEGNTEMTIKSKLESVINMDGKGGVYLTGNLPTSGAAASVTGTTFKLCACTSGLLFKVKMDATQKTCADLNGICA